MFSFIYSKMMEFCKKDISKKILVLAVILLTHSLTSIWAGTYEWSGTTSDNTNIAAPSGITLTDDAEFTDAVKLYKKDWIEIDLKGHNLTISTLHIGNDSTETGWVKITDSVGGGTVSVGTLSTTTYALDKKKLEIDSGVTFTINTEWKAGTNVLNGGVTISGSGTLEINGSVDHTTKISLDSTNTPTITGTNMTAITEITGTVPITEYVWTGAVGTDFTDAGNWQGGTAPASSSTAEILIPVVTSDNYPVIPAGSALEFSSLTLEPGANLTSNSSLTIDTVTAGGTLTLNSTLIAQNILLSGNLTVNNSADLLVANGITGGSYNLTVGPVTSNGPISCSSFTASGSVLCSELSCDDLSLTDELICLTGDLTVNGKINQSKNISAASISVAGSSSLNGTITTTGTQTYTGAVTLAGDTTILAGSNDVTFSSTISGATHNLTIGSATQETKPSFNGNITNVQTLTLYGDTNLNANASVAIWNNANDSEINPAATSTVTVSSQVLGDNTFTNLSVASTSRSIKFQTGKTQTVTGTFTAKGGSATDKLVIDSTDHTAGTGQWRLNASTANTNIEFATVGYTDSANLIYPANSIYGYGTNYATVIISSEYRWKEVASDTTVENPLNWEVKDGNNWISSSMPPYTQNDIITIQESNIYPVFSPTPIPPATTGDFIVQKLTINENAELTLANTYDIKVKDSFTNNGTVIYSAAGRIKNNNATSSVISDSSHGTVEFAAGSATVDNIGTGDDYYNLVISGSVALDGQIKAAGTFKNSAEITTGTSLEVTGTSEIGATITTTGTQTYTGAVTLADDAILNGTTIKFASTVESKGTSKFDITVNGTADVNNLISNVDDFTSTVLIVNNSDASGNSIDISGNLSTTSTGTTSYFRGNVKAASVEIPGPLTFGQKTRSVTTTGNQLYKKAVQINSNSEAETLTLTSGTSGSVTFESTIDAYSNSGTPTEYAQLIVNSSNVTFKEKIGNTNALNALTITGATTFDTDATLIKTTDNQTYNSATTLNAATTFDGPVINKGTITVPSVASGTAIEFTGGYSGSGSLIGVKTSAADLTPDPDIVFSGGTVKFTNFTQNGDNVKFAPAAGKTCTFNSNGIALSKVEFAGPGTTTLNAALNTDYLTLSGGTLTDGAKNITVTNDWTHTGGTFTSTGKVTVNENVSGTNNFNDLVLKGNISGNHTSIKSLTIEGTGTSEISGSNTITTFTCITPDKHIQFAPTTTQTITNLKINGDNSTTPVILDSSTATWNIKATNSDIIYASIKNSNAFPGGTQTIRAHLSKNDGNNNANWIFAENYTWTGATGTNWTDSSNWTIKIGTDTINAVFYPGENTKGDTATIPNTTNKPVLSSALTYSLDSMTIAANSSLELSSANDINLSKTTSPITNNGTVIYSSTGRIKNADVTPKVIADNAKGTVQFKSDAAKIDDIYTDTTNDYNNVTVSSAVSLDGDIYIKGNLKANGEITGTAHAISIGGTLTTTEQISGITTLDVTSTSSIGANITSTGDQTFTDAVTFTAASVTFDAGTNSTIFNKAINGLASGTTALTYKNASIKNTTSKISTLTANGTTANSGTITTSGLQTYNGLVTNTGTINVPPLTTAGATAVEFKAGYTGTGGSLIGASTAADKTPDPYIVFSGTGDVIFGTFTNNNDNIRFTSTGNFNSNSQQLADIYFEGTGTVTLTSALKTVNLNLAGATLAAVGKNITVSNDWKHTSGTFTSSATVTVTRDVSGTNSFYNLIVGHNLTGEHTITNNLTFNGTTESKITDSNTAKNFICQTASKVLTFTKGKTQTVTGSLTLNGQAAGTEITLKSDSSTYTAADQWLIDTTGATTSVSFVKVQNSKSTQLILTASSASLGNNVNWAIASNFKWTGKTDTDFKTNTNWVITYGGTDYPTNDYPGKFGTSGIYDSADISTTQTSNIWPTFTDTTASLILNKISIGTNGSLTLSGTKDLQLNASTTPLSNSGKIVYSNTGRIKNNAATPAPIMDTAKGLVVYNGNADKITNINTLPTGQTTEPTDYFNLLIEKDIPLGGCITVANNFTLNTGKNITSPDGTAYRFIVRNNGNANTCSIGGNITTTDLQKYQSKVTLTKDVILKAKNNITFESNGTINGADYDLTLDTDGTHQSNYEFKKNVTVKTLTVHIPSAKSLSVSGGTTVSASNGFTADGAGNVSLGTTGGAAATIKTANTNINFLGTGTITLLSAVTLNTDTENGNVVIEKNTQGTTANSQSLTITAGTGNINLQSDIGTTVSLGNTNISGAEISLSDSKALKASSIEISGTKITAEENSKLTSASTVKITNSNLFRTKEGTEITAATGFTKLGNGLSQIAGTIKTSDAPISFNTDTYIDNEASFDASNGGTIASPSADITIGTISDQKDLYISAINGATPQTVSFKAGTLNVSGNIALFNGKVSLVSNMTSGKDIILLNGTASTMYNDDHNTDKSSGVSNLFDYHNPLRKAENMLCAPSLVYKEPGSTVATASQYPECFPDDAAHTIDHTAYNSTLTGYNGKTIKASQNFYDNGVNFNSESSWTLTILENDDARNSFAEIYNAEISGCTVTSINGGYAWLSAAENCTGTGGPLTDSTNTITYNEDGTYSRQLTGIAFLYPVILVNDNGESASEGRKTGPEIPNLSGTYSVRDNVIRIEFVRSNAHNKTALIENSNDEITRAMADAVRAIRFNGNTGLNLFEDGEAYIDAECTTSTRGQGDIAVFYIKARSDETWNLVATGTKSGNPGDGDSHGVHQDKTIDLTIERALSTVFYTLTDEHKNRICSYKNNPAVNPNDTEGFRFTATATRCAVAEMHITFAIADFTSNKIYLYFDNPLSDLITWKTFKPETEDEKKTESSIKIITRPENIATETYVSNPVVSVSKEGISDNGIILYLQNNLDYSMIEYGIVVKYGGTFLFNNKIHSPDNKVVVDGESHCISDVITSCVDVQYAYDNRNDTYIESTGGIAPVDSIVMRDFTGEGKHNKVFADKNITLVTKDIAPKDGNNNDAGFKYKLVADITPTSGCEGTIYELYSGHKTRFWFTDATNPVSRFAPSWNKSANIRNSASNPDLITQTINTDNITYLFHNFSEETPCLNWTSPSDVRFLFEVLKSDGTPYSINHSYNTTATQVTPLYCARLKNPLDITSIDLWSFLITEPQRQRGGATIYSNVINATNKDFCTLEVNMPKDGNLRVIIMTADGNIVKYLENGRQSQGLHYYYWNGTNNAGDTVARGIYFIRVVGPDIEETRKVMVVK